MAESGTNPIPVFAENRRALGFAPEAIDPEICAAVEYWSAMKIQERAGRGTEYADGDKGYEARGWFQMLFEECPAAIVAILKAGAEAHVGQVSYTPDGSAQRNDSHAEPDRGSSGYQWGNRR